MTNTTNDKVYYVHCIGPDNVFGPMNKEEASTLANNLNKASAEALEMSSAPEFFPHTWAIVKTHDEIYGGAA